MIAALEQPEIAPAIFGSLGLVSRVLQGDAGRIERCEKLVQIWS